MARLGAFDPGLQPLALFDSTAVAVGWFSDDLIDSGAVPITGAAAITLPAHKGALGDAFRPAGSVLVQGGAAVSLPIHTAIAAGAVLVLGAASVTLPILTSSAASSVEVAGAASVTLPVLASSAAGAIAVQGSASTTLPTLTSTAAGTGGTVTTGRVTQIAQLVSYVPTPTGRVTQVAVLYSVPYVRKRGHIIIAKKTVGAVVVPGGAAAITLPVHVAAATGVAAIAGAAAITLHVHTAVGQGAVAGGGAITGNANVTLPAHTAVAAGTVLVQGSTGSIDFRLLEGGVNKRLLEAGAGFRILQTGSPGAVVLPVLTSAATATASMQAAAAVTLPAHVAAGAGTVASSGAVTGNASVVLPLHTAVALGSVLIKGAASVTLPTHKTIATYSPLNSPSTVYPYIPRPSLYSTLPQVYVDTRYPSVSWTDTVFVDQGNAVANGAAFQAMINTRRALPGHQRILIPNTLRLQANFVGPACAAGRGTWLSVECLDKNGFPPEAVRYDRRAMSGITLPTFVLINNNPLLNLLHADSGWLRLVGLNFQFEPYNTSQDIYGMLRFGDPQEALDVDLPEYVIVDRCRVGALNPQTGLRRGVVPNGPLQAVIDSDLSDIHNSAGCQSINTSRSPGPLKVVNNWLGGSTENFMIGGSSTGRFGLVPSDIEFRRNFMYAPVAWFKRWERKNPFEIKNGQRLLYEGNVVENTWADGQQGMFMNLKGENQTGQEPYSLCKDVTIRYSRFKNGSQVATSAQGGFGSGVTEKPSRVSIEHVLFEEIGKGIYRGVDTASTKFFTFANGPLSDYSVEHVTVIITTQGTAFVWGGTSPTPGLRVRDSIISNGSFGVYKGSPAQGTATLNFHVKDPISGLPNWIASRLAILDGTNWGATNPADHWFVPTAAMNFVDAANLNWRLIPGTLYAAGGARCASDGTDLGANIDDIDLATSGVRPASGAAPATPTGLAAIANSPTQVTLTFNAVQGGFGGVVQRSSNGGATYAYIKGFTHLDTSFIDTGRTSGATYHYRIYAQGLGGDSPFSAAVQVTMP